MEEKEANIRFILAASDICAESVLNAKIHGFLPHTYNYKFPSGLKQVSVEWLNSLKTSDTNLVKYMMTDYYYKIVVNEIRGRIYSGLEKLNLPIMLLIKLSNETNHIIFNHIYASLNTPTAFILQPKLFVAIRNKLICSGIPNEKINEMGAGCVNAC